MSFSTTISTQTQHHFTQNFQRTKCFQYIEFYLNNIVFKLKLMFQNKHYILLEDELMSLTTNQIR